MPPTETKDAVLTDKRGPPTSAGELERPEDVEKEVPHSRKVRCTDNNKDGLANE